MRKKSITLPHAAPVTARALTMTKSFVDFAISLNEVALPVEVQRNAGLCILDFLTACLRAHDLD
jgi:hypothetical protein